MSDPQIHSQCLSLEFIAVLAISSHNLNQLARHIFQIFLEQDLIYDSAKSSQARVVHLFGQVNILILLFLPRWFL